jgi:GYF domain 2
MKQYYLHDGQNQIGPFSSEELKEKNINQETYVWKEGMTDWVKANEIAELKALFTNTPPPFKGAAVKVQIAPTTTQKTTKSNTAKTGMWIGRNPKITVLILILAIIAGVATYSSQHSNDSYTNDIYDAVAKTPAELRMELQEKEQEHPQDYLQSEITMRGNLIGEKVFEGTLSNSASIAIFKDVVIEVSYLSKTESVISKEKFSIYEVIAPQKTISIKKIKTFAPNGTEGFSANIVSALLVE